MSSLLGNLFKNWMWSATRLIFEVTQGIKETTVHLFADDTSILTSGNDLKMLAESIQNEMVKLKKIVWYKQIICELQ